MLVVPEKVKWGGDEKKRASKCHGVSRSLNLSFLLHKPGVTVYSQIYTEGPSIFLDMPAVVALPLPPMPRFSPRAWICVTLDHRRRLF